MQAGLGHCVNEGSSYSHQVRAARVRIDRHSRFGSGFRSAADEWVVGDRFAARLGERGGNAKIITRPSWARGPIRCR